MNWVKNKQPARKKMGTINELSASWVLNALWQIALLALTESAVASDPVSTSAGHPVRNAMPSRTSLRPWRCTAWFGC
jgi:hypothetical protein